MRLTFKGFTFDAMGAAIYAVPILAVAFLMCLVMLQGDALVTEASFNNQQFIAMPKNCYLKTP